MPPQVYARDPSPEPKAEHPPALRRQTQHHTRQLLWPSSAHIAASLPIPERPLTCVLFRQAGPGDKIPSIIVDDGFGPIVEVDIAERCAGQRVILLG